VESTGINSSYKEVESSCHSIRNFILLDSTGILTFSLPNLLKYSSGFQGFKWNPLESSWNWWRTWKTSCDLSILTWCVFYYSSHKSHQQHCASLYWIFELQCHFSRPLNSISRIGLIPAFKPILEIPIYIVIDIYTLYLDYFFSYIVISEAIF